MSRIDVDPTSPEERAAAAISTYAVAISLRVARGPWEPIPQDEMDAYAALKSALADLAQDAYDSGYRKAYNGIFRSGGRMARLREIAERDTLRAMAGVILEGRQCSFGRGHVTALNEIADAIDRAAEMGAS